MIPYDNEIQSVVDSSAMMSYARGLDAYTQVGTDLAAHARLGVLATLPSVKVLPLGPAEASEVATIVRLVKGDLARAHAVWAGLKHGAYYLTCEAQLTPTAIEPFPITCRDCR